MPTWPGSLPQSALIDSYKEEGQDNLIRFSPDIGPPKVRRTSSIQLDKIVASFIMTLAQFNTFKAFFKNDLFDGALTFTSVDFRNGTAGQTYQFTGVYTNEFFTPSVIKVTLPLIRLV